MDDHMEIYIKGSECGAVVKKPQNRQNLPFQFN